MDPELLIDGESLSNYLVKDLIDIDPQNPQPRYKDFTVPIEKRVAPRKGGITSMGFAAEGMTPGQRFPGDTKGEASQRSSKNNK